MKLSSVFKPSMITVLFIILVVGACSPAAAPEPSSTPPLPSAFPTGEPTETLEPTLTSTSTEIPLTDVERSFNPADGYRVDLLVNPPVGDLFTVAVSESGRIYAQSIGGWNRGIYLCNPDTDTMDLVNDGAAGGIHIFGGPGDTVFIRDDSNSTVRMLYPDGSTEQWSINLGVPENPRPSTYTQDGRMSGHIGDSTRTGMYSLEARWGSSGCISRS